MRCLPREGTRALIPSRPLLTEPNLFILVNTFQRTGEWPMVLSKEWEVIDGTLHRIRLWRKQETFTRIHLQNASSALNWMMFMIFAWSPSLQPVSPYSEGSLFYSDRNGQRGPISMRHGECAYLSKQVNGMSLWSFMKIKWLLHHEHLAYGKHPIINQERTYLAAVDQAGASFDNLQVWHSNSSQENNLQLIAKQSGKFPTKTVQKNIILLQPTFNPLHGGPKIPEDGQRCDKLDSKERAFPQAFSSHKIFKSKFNHWEKTPSRRSVYRDIIFATHAPTEQRSVSSNAKAIRWKLSASKQKAARKDYKPTETTVSI